MHSELTYRNGNINNVNQIKELTLLAYMQFRDILTEENVIEWQEYLGNENIYTELFKTAFCFVCEYNNKIIGSAFLIPQGNPYKWFDAHCAYIRLVAVHPAFEGKGIGRNLTQLCIDKAKDIGENTIALHTSEFQNAARHIYEKMGFVKIKDLDLMFGKQYYLYTFQLKNQ